jgi:hypothetical protein
MISKEMEIIAMGKLNWLKGKGLGLNFTQTFQLSLTAKFSISSQTGEASLTRNSRGGNSKFLNYTLPTN